MVEKMMPFDAGYSVDVVTIVDGLVAELSLHVSQLATQLEENCMEGGSSIKTVAFHGFDISWEQFSQMPGYQIDVPIHSYAFHELNFQGWRPI